MKPESRLCEQVWFASTAAALVIGLTMAVAVSPWFFILFGAGALSLALMGGVYV